MATRHFVAAALLLGFAATFVAATPGCKTIVSGETSLFGAPTTKPSDRFEEQVAKWFSAGDITKLQLFYSANAGCVLGIKPTYGYDAKNAQLLGLEKNLQGAHLILTKDEQFIEAEYKAGPKCIEYLKFRTNKGRTLAIGDSKSSTMTSTVTVNRQGGFLASVKGWVDTAGALQQLRLVWGLRDCTQAAPAPAPAPAPAAEPVPEPAAEPAPEPAAEAAAPAEEPAVEVTETTTEVVEPTTGGGEEAEAVETVETVETVDAPPAEAPAADATVEVTETEVVAVPAAAAPAAPAAAPEVPTAKCAAKTDMCDASASAGVLNSCKAVAPFTAAQCVGGCCISSGRCKYGSCFANGLGKEAPMTCFGTNNIPNPLALLGNKCGHLACKLAVPGCKTAVMGGNCVGTVVAVQNASKLHPLGAKYIGYPCVETTPTAGLFNLPKSIDIGLPVHEYVIATWSACSCSDALTMEGLGLDLAGLEKAAGHDLAGLEKAAGLKLPSLPHLQMPHLPDVKIPQIPTMQIPKIPGLPKIQGPMAMLARAKNGSLLAGLGGHAAAAAAGDAGGDSSLGVGGLTAMKDLLLAPKDTGADPFAAFVDADAAAAAAAPGAASAEGLAAGAPEDAGAAAPAETQAAPAEAEAVENEAGAAVGDKLADGTVAGDEYASSEGAQSSEVASAEDLAGAEAAEPAAEEGVVAEEGAAPAAEDGAQYAAEGEGAPSEGVEAASVEGTEEASAGADAGADAGVEGGEEAGAGVEGGEESA